MKVLITGSSGAGKTFLTYEFKKLGLHTEDSDQIHGLDSWYDGQGNKVSAPDDAGKEFLDNHSFLWDREFLKNYLERNPDIYIFGMSGNAFEMRDLFDKVYFLQVPPEILEERVQHESRENPMGKTQEQRIEVLKWAKEIEDEAKCLGIEFIDGTLSPIQIAERITKK